MDEFKKSFRVKADEEEEEEMVDPMDVLREECSKRKDCGAFQTRLEECNSRVNSRSNTSEECMEELIDFLHCVDHCVSHSLFSKLKWQTASSVRGAQDLLIDVECV